MVMQFGGYGFGGPQLTQKNALLAGQTLTGHRFTLSELVYNGPAWLGAQTNKSYAIDMFGVTDMPQAYGFATREEAERFIHSMSEEEYTAHDIHGNEGKTKRVGLGVPDGMVSRLDGSASPSQAKLANALELAARIQAERQVSATAPQVPENPDIKPSSRPAEPLPWPTASVPVPDVANTEKVTDAYKSIPGATQPVGDAYTSVSGTAEATTDGSNATRAGDADVVPQSMENPTSDPEDY